jgi:hypothetical protein
LRPKLKAVSKRVRIIAALFSMPRCTKCRLARKDCISQPCSGRDYSGLRLQIPPNRIPRQTDGVGIAVASYCQAVCDCCASGSFPTGPFCCRSCASCDYFEVNLTNEVNGGLLIPWLGRAFEPTILMQRVSEATSGTDRRIRLFHCGGVDIEGLESLDCSVLG